MRRGVVLIAVAAMAASAACSGTAPAGAPSGAPSGTPAGAATPTPRLAAPTPAPLVSIKPLEIRTPEPTAAPTPGVLVAGDTLTYTSSTSVGRLIELTVTVRNKGKKAAGKITVEVEALGFVLKRKTPLTGCSPKCRGATGADGIAYVQWTGPAAGKSKTYAVQLKAKARGTYKFEVRLYAGSTGSYDEQLGSWTVTCRVR